MLGQAAQTVQDAKSQAVEAPSVSVSETANEGAKHHTTAKSYDEQKGNFSSGKFVVRVQCIHVRALQPVGHHCDEVYHQVPSLKLLEVLGDQYFVFRFRADYNYGAYDT